MNEYPFEVDIAKRQQDPVFGTIYIVNFAPARDIKQWCIRTLKYCEYSNDLRYFRFRTERDMALFLLRWGSYYH